MKKKISLLVFAAFCLLSCIILKNELSAQSVGQSVDTVEKKIRKRKTDASGTDASGKDYKSERIKGMWSVDMSIGRHKRKTGEGDDHDAFYFETGLMKLLKRNLGLRVGLNYEKGVIGFVSYNRILIVPELLYNIFSIGGRLYFSVNAGLPAGYEQVSNVELPESFSYLVYGAAIGFLTELNLSNSILLTMGVKENIMFGSKLGRLDYQLQAGIKFYF